jgi:CheY-like chemotaxis protein
LRTLPDVATCVAQAVEGSGGAVRCRVRTPAACADVLVSGKEYFCRHARRAEFVERFQRKRDQLRSVLCVDDEGDIRQIVKHALLRFGKVQVHLCDDSRAAAEMARSLHPDLILLDLVMPYVDGRAVFEQLKADAATAGIPVVFFTAFVTRTNTDDLLRRGAAGVIPKPFDVQELVNRMLEIWCERAP